jgi:hypothetical protein
MERSYAPLPSHGMEPGTTFQQPVLPEPKRVRPDDAALEVMTDFRQVRAVTVMTPRERLEVIPIEAVQGAHVGHVAATLKAVGRQHAMVVDRDAQGRQRVRGLFAVSQLNRQLGSALQPLEVARNFAEVETALGPA